MSIYINVNKESYKQISNIFLKEINSYTEICKVYICTGPGQYELLFDTCESILCDGSEEECSDCVIQWSSIYDNLLLSTDGPTPLGLTKLICPSSFCANGGISTGCADTNETICCNCPITFPSGTTIPFEACEPIYSPNCPCIKLKNNQSCDGLPKFIQNTCQAYIWTALGGDLIETSNSTCKNCIDFTKTIVGKCCKDGKKYSYLKDTTWIKDPTVESDCGIVKNCPVFASLNYYDPEGDYSQVIDYGYSIYVSEIDEGGVASDNSSNPVLGSCPFTCANSLSRCYINCLCNESAESWCNAVCGTSNGDRCRDIWSKFANTVGEWDDYVCLKCSSFDCGNCVPPPEGCDICAKEPCSNRCFIDCGSGRSDQDFCDIYCNGTSINWQCILNSIGDVLFDDFFDNIFVTLKQRNCPCAPDYETCNDICYDAFDGTNN